MENEIWHEVPGYEGHYEVSDHGRVRAVRRGRILRQRAESRGYRRVNLWRDGRMKTMRVHRIVLMAFVGPAPVGAEGCHNDSNPEHNALLNLRWDSHAANVRDMVNNGTHVGANRAAAKCHRGHELTPIAMGSECKPCRNERLAARRARRPFDPARADARNVAGARP